MDIPAVIAGDPAGPDPGDYPVASPAEPAIRLTSPDSGPDYRASPPADPAG